MSELYNVNCVDFLQKCIEEGRHFNYCITSPPYNMNVEVRNDGTYKSRITCPQNDKHLARKYENYTDDLTNEEYFNLLDSVLEKTIVLCDIVFMNIQMVTGNKLPLFQILGKYSNFIKEVIIWDKVNGQPAIQDGVLNSAFEFIFVFTKDKPFKRRFENAKFGRGEESNVWHISKKANKFNKASFPEELIVRLLNDFTNKEDTIIDPFMGSGTTGIVCANMKRNFVGCEVDREMFEVAQARIQQAEFTAKHSFF